MSDKVCRLKFELSSYWRIGSGKGSGAVADALVLRDASGLPVIPGKAVKGLLRDAMTVAAVSGTVSAERITQWFGSALAGSGDHESTGDEQERSLEEGRFSSTEGALWFGSAQLSEEWRRWARSAGESEKKDVLAALTTYQSSTSIERSGVAKDHSLRVAEVAVPMELTAELRGPSDDTTWIEDVRAALPILRAIGSRRSRGLGRTQVTMEVLK